MRAIAAAALLALASPAAARAADLGGGTASDSLRGYRSQLTVVTLRTEADGRSAVVRVLVPARCGVAAIARRGVAIAPDGSFAFAATARDRAPEDPRVRRIASVLVSGRIVGTAVTGTASARVRLVLHGRTVDRCTTGGRAWQARTPLAEPVSGPPRAESAYYGLTAQPARPHGLVLRVGPGATRIQTAAFQYRLACGGRAFERDNITPGGPIAADGTFHLSERFTLRYSTGFERFRVKVDGQFTPAGANGTLSVRSVYHHGSAETRCATGAVRWAAAL
jgi:hypothetical protein